MLKEGGEERARECAQRIVGEAFGSPFHQAGIPISVQMRIGAVIAPDFGQEPEALLLRSGIAARHAKAAGMVFKLYEGPRESESPRHLALITDLRAAIDEKQFVLHYQPKVDLFSGGISGVEALVRWQHPERGFIPPDEFIGLAEQTGLIEPLTYLVLEMALQQCHLWSIRGFKIPVAVNISVNSFYDPDFLSRINHMIRAWKVKPEQLQLEITESTLMMEPARVYDLLVKLKEEGVVVYIDDFGTGYSSLNYIANLPVHALKIDRSFIASMLESARIRSVIEATISLANSLGVRTIAEGVESKEQVETLFMMKCNEIQGYYFSKPLKEEELRSWARNFSLEAYGISMGTNQKPNVC